MRQGVALARPPIKFVFSLRLPLDPFSQLKTLMTVPLLLAVAIREPQGENFSAAS